MKDRYVLGIDPSGNFEEGKGTTGLCVFDRQLNVPIWSGFVQAKLYNTQLDYWDAVLDVIEVIKKQYKGVILSIEDYILYQNTAMSQVNSSFETSQLIGVLKYFCYKNHIRIYFRPASRVKKRWSEDILLRKHYLKYNKRVGYYIEDEEGVMIQMVEHQRDALKHAVHCAIFELKGEKK